VGHPGGADEDGAPARRAARAKFLDERRKTMQQWADYLDAAASDGKVVVGKFGRSA